MITTEVGAAMVSVMGTETAWPSRASTARALMENVPGALAVVAQV